MSERFTWESLFEEYKTSGLTKTGFCKQKAISYDKFQYYWHRGNKNTFISNPPLSEKSGLSVFESVTIKEKQVSFSASISLVIQLPNQISCEIKEGYTAAMLPGLLKQLGQIC